MHEDSTEVLQDSTSYSWVDHVMSHYCLMGQVEDWLVVGNERRKLGRNARLAPSLLG